MRSYETELQPHPLPSPQEIITSLIAVCLLLLGSLRRSFLKKWSQGTFKHQSLPIR